MALRVGIVRDDRYLEHKTGIIHPEHPNRLKYVYNMIDAEFSREVESIEPQLITLGDLEFVHKPEYVKKVLHTANLEFTHLAQDTPASPRTYMAAWLAAGGCITALESLRAGRYDVCFALVRPPGHHALPGRSGGFCIFNNLGITARYAMRRYGYKRILIVDWDVHHGNALQELFYREQEVLYMSSHYTNIYPFAGHWHETGVGEGEGYTVNVVLTKGIEDLDLIHVYRGVVGGAILRYRPELIMVAAGFDLHNQDIFSRAKVTEWAFGMLTRLILEFKQQIGDPPLLLALEGGYRITALVKSVREV
ncbi:MAG: histone deacetylase, partial [Deltaproteobacteria bacterium]|nr:histone deacetylase [Deltaproteobacteria bacterium]